MHNSLPLVLASSSTYRAELLTRLQLPFVSASPHIDESALPNEAPEQLVKRLAQQKAEALSETYTNHLIIGSDQVAVFNETILGKPGTRERAIEQLMSFQGHSVQFLTGLCVLNTTTHEARVLCEPFMVHFRTLPRTVVERYVDKEQPLDCAGSFKSEGLGICLFEKLEGHDPNSLIGLPLIQLCNMLEYFGVSPLQE